MGRKLLKWNEWCPGLDTENLTIREVLMDMPRSDPKEVPAIVHKYENPNSPEAFPGAITLERHDCLHALLGRGLLVQDEAFIIGATMGSVSHLSDKVIEDFIEISTTVYPKAWRFQQEHILSFRLGVGFAEDLLKEKDIHLIPFESDSYINKPILEIRKELGLVKAEMRAYFRSEQILVPGSRATMRLDSQSNKD